MKSIKCAVIITREDDWIIASDYSSGVTSQGRTVDEALENLKEALELYYEDTDVSELPNSLVMTSLVEVSL